MDDHIDDKERALNAFNDSFDRLLAMFEKAQMKIDECQIILEGFKQSGDESNLIESQNLYQTTLDIEFIMGKSREVINNRSIEVVDDSTEISENDRVKHKEFMEKALSVAPVITIFFEAYTIFLTSKTLFTDITNKIIERNIHPQDVQAMLTYLDLVRDIQEYTQLTDIYPDLEKKMLEEALQMREVFMDMFKRFDWDSLLGDL